MKKTFFTAFTVMLVSSPAFCETSTLGKIVKDGAIIGASTTGCVGGLLGQAATTRGRSSVVNFGLACGAGAVVVGGATAAIGEAVAEEAPAQKDLETHEIQE